MRILISLLMYVGLVGGASNNFLRAKLYQDSDCVVAHSGSNAIRLHTCSYLSRQHISTWVTCDAGLNCTQQAFSSTDCSGAVQDQSIGQVADGKCRSFQVNGKTFYHTSWIVDQSKAQDGMGYPRVANYLNDNCGTAPNAMVVAYSDFSFCNNMTNVQISTAQVCSADKKTITMNTYADATCSGTPQHSIPLKGKTPGVCDNAVQTTAGDNHSVYRLGHSSTLLSGTQQGSYEWMC